MTEPSYWIFVGDEIEPAAGDIPDLQEARDAAAEISQQHPDSHVSLFSRGRQPSGEFTSKIASFQNGEEVPWRWRVDFFGYLMDVDHFRLSESSIFFEGAHSEIGPRGELRTGFARNVVGVEAADGGEAIAKVKSALGPQADRCSEWHCHPAQ